MKWPPYLMHFKIRNPQHTFSIWLPLFIIGPIALVFLLALLLIALPFLVLSVIFTGRWIPLRKAWTVTSSVVGILHGLNGLKVDVEDHGQHVLIVIR